MNTIVILVTFNPGKYIDYVNDNIKTILEMNENVDFLLIDNSTEKQQITDLINKYKSEDHFKYIVNSSNKGPGSGFNQGIKYAIYHKYDYCYLVDQDSKVNKSSIEKLMNYAKYNIEFSFLTSKVLSESENKILNYFRVRFNNRMSYYFVNNSKYENELIEVDAAGYTGVFLNLNLIDKNNIYINEQMFIAYDDYDFTYRLSRISKAYIITDSSITHPNKRTRYNSRMSQFIFNYIRQIPYSNNFRKNKAAQNYMYMIHNYGSSFAKFIKLNLIICMIGVININIYKKAKSMLKIINQNEELQ